ncbi:MAG: hypothetical protein DDG59_07635 [Anaerolineae bacterium]|jgi:hypothetical protein|nr:MAG: hypothetical protein DDG59_07635 [Anaerolineae bacterium]
MSQSVTLFPLNCIRCATPIPAEVNEVAWLCSICGASMALTEAGEIVPCEFHFSTDLPAGKKGRPFWVAEGVVRLIRQSYNRIGKSDQEAIQFWSQPRRFFIPAYDCGLEEMLTIGTRWLTKPPPLFEGAKSDFLPITQSAADVRAFAEFLIIAIEAARKDKVKEIQFELEMGVPQLWILP